MPISPYGFGTTPGDGRTLAAVLEAYNQYIGAYVDAETTRAEAAEAAMRTADRAQALALQLTLGG